jgi:APA family basic amino acid/polyamine antiporter
VSDPGPGQPRLVRRLGLFDATMLVMGGIVGSGIFLNPAEVARQVDTPFLIVGVWLLGGLIAIAGAFVYAELAARRPEVGGQYAYLRDAWGPMPAFLYGWALLLVIQSGGMAAVAITFARYFLELTHLPLPDGAVAAAALALLTAINCLGVRAGANVQSGLMVLKIVAILFLVSCGLLLAPAFAVPAHATAAATPLGTLGAIGGALTPVMFAYGGWQTASFVAAEMRDPRRDLARGLLLGVIGVILLYTGVAFACVQALGPAGLAATHTPATAVMRLALGESGATLIALGIAISALGFLSQGMLTAPRVYFAMAEDKLFFRGVAKVDARTHVPIVAILLQGLAAILIALSGTYGQILSYVVSVDFIFFGLTGAALFAFRRRDGEKASFEVPLHPWTTLLFVIACAVIVVATVWNNPVNSLIGFAILALGIPACLYWQHRAISSQMDSSDDSEIAAREQLSAVDLMQSDHKPL